MSAGTPDRLPSQKAAHPKATGDLRSDSGEELSATAEKTHNSGNSSDTNDIRSGGDKSAFVATTAPDEGDWLLDDRPTGQSSLAESREVRRSSLNDMDFEEDKARCMPGAAVDVLYEAGAEGLGEEDLETDDGDASRSNSSWKWEFTGWGGAGSGGTGKDNGDAAVNGVVLSRKGGTRK